MMYPAEVPEPACFDHRPLRGKSHEAMLFPKGVRESIRDHCDTFRKNSIPAAIYRPYELVKAGPARMSSYETVHLYEFQISRHIEHVDSVIGSFGVRLCDKNGRSHRKNRPRRKCAIQSGGQFWLRGHSFGGAIRVSSAPAQLVKIQH